MSGDCVVRLSSLSTLMTSALPTIYFPPETVALLKHKYGFNAIKDPSHLPPLVAGLFSKPTASIHGYNNFLKIAELDENHPFQIAEDLGAMMFFEAYDFGPRDHEFENESFWREDDSDVYNYGRTFNHRLASLPLEFRHWVYAQARTRLSDH